MSGAFPPRTVMLNPTTNPAIANPTAIRAQVREPNAPATRGVAEPRG